MLFHSYVPGGSQLSLVLIRRHQPPRRRSIPDRRTPLRKRGKERNLIHLLVDRSGVSGVQWLPMPARKREWFEKFSQAVLVFGPDKSPNSFPPDTRARTPGATCEKNHVEAVFLD